MPNSIEWTFLNTVLSDVHRIASGAGATVAVLSDLSNGKSRVCIPGRYHRRPVAGPLPHRNHRVYICGNGISLVSSWMQRHLFALSFCLVTNGRSSQAR